MAFLLAKKKEKAHFPRLTTLRGALGRQAEAG